MSRPIVAIGSALAFLVAVAGCASTGDNDSRVLLMSSPAVGAKLAARGGSAVAGLILFRRREGGLTMVVQLHDVMVGPYRVAIHTTGNCSSPNAFSAGPPWALPGGIPQIYGGEAGNGGLLMMTASLDGVSIDGPNGILAKSVVVHQGLAGPVDAQPGVPNNRVACGVIENIASPEF